MCRPQRAFQMCNVNIHDIIQAFQELFLHSFNPEIHEIINNFLVIYHRKGKTLLSISCIYRRYIDEEFELSELVLALFTRSLDFSYPLANVLVSFLKSVIENCM